MQIKCGTDIIEIERIKQSIEKSSKSFINKIYTKNEIEYCETKGKQKFQHYAARFAAKEAIFKAISETLKNKYELDWKDYEIICDSDGKPKININRINTENIENIDISLSHCKKYAVATVIAIIK